MRRSASCSAGRASWSGIVILTFWLICAVLAIFEVPYTPWDPFDGYDLTIDNPAPPSAEHLMGTDRLGRDVFSRVLYGARDVFTVAPPAALIGVVLGTLLGLIMGFYRGLADDVLSRIVEAFLALPVIMVALLTLVVLGSSSIVVIGVVGILFTPIVARTVRSAVLAERQLDYVTAAELRGESGLFIMVREILPNIAGPIVVELTVRFGYAIFTVATLSFLGRRSPAAVAGLGPDGQSGVLEHDQRRLVADRVPGAGHRHDRRRGQPDRRRPAVGAVRMTATIPAPPVPEPGTTAALKVEDLSLAYMVRGIPRPVLAWRLVRDRPGRGVRPRRRVRLRQVDDRLRGRPLPARATAASPAGGS